MELTKLAQDVQPLIEKCARYESLEEDLSEDDVKTRLIEPLFKALGWDVEDRLGEGQVREQRHQPQGRPDYIFYVGDRIAFFLEAKKLKEITDKDILQARSYAQSKGKRWAVLTNFKEILILICDKKEASLRNHIYKRIGLLDYATDLDLLALLSRESFSTGAIDEAARKDGQLRRLVSIDEELLEDIDSWRNRLSKSIRRNNRRTYDPEVLEDIVQTILDRILFIRTVEDRKKEAVPDDTLRALVQEHQRDKRIDLKSRLDQLFRSYDRIYDSKLFTYDEGDRSARHECENVAIDNETLQSVLSGTFEKGETLEYNFADIDADVLGTVYENYLGRIQRRRKENGIYYTPTYIVSFIVRKVFGGKLAALNPEAIRKLRVLDPACGSGSFLTKAFESLTESLRAADPEQFRQKRLGSDEKVIHTIQDLIIEHCLYGVDVDGRATNIAKLNLLLKAMEDESVRPHKLPQLENNIFIGDSIEESNPLSFDWSGTFPEPFDAVIGNPPYIAWSRIKPRKSLEDGTFDGMSYHCRPNHEDAQPNVYLFFVVRGLAQCRGRLGFILPTEWLSARYATDFRDYILSHSGKITIFKFHPDFRVFKAHGVVGTNSLILVVDAKSKEMSAEQYFIDETSDDGVRRALEDDNYLQKVSKRTRTSFRKLVGADWNLLDGPGGTPKLRGRHVVIDNPDYFDVIGGFQPPIDRIADFQLDEVGLRAIPSGERDIIHPALVSASSISRYSLRDEGRFWIIANSLDETELRRDYPAVHATLSKRIRDRVGEWWKFPNIRNLELFTQYPTKILSPRTAARNSFSIDPKGTVFKGTNAAILCKKMSPYFVAGVLNSSFANEWYSRHGMGYHGSTRKYEPGKIRSSKLPIPVVSTSKEAEIEGWVRELISLTSETERMANVSRKAFLTQKIDALESKLDAEVRKALLG